MAKENKSRYAVLGMLSICPMSGYNIKKFMEQSTSNFWNESYGQIYPILKQLTDEELTTARTEKQEGKPERYIYTLTENGWDELRRWLTEPIEWTVERNELLLKLFFGRQVPISTNIAHLQKFRALQERVLHKYTEIEKSLKTEGLPDLDLSYSLITLSYGLHRCRSLLEWCEETLATLNGLVQIQKAEGQ